MRALSLRIIFLSLTTTSCLGQSLPQPTLETLRAAIADQTYPKIDAILVQHNDHLLIEEYFNEFDRDSLHDTRSAFKSITSLLTGIALDQALFSLEDSLGYFFPELGDDPKAGITIRQLLEMRSGLDCEEFYGIGPDCETDMMESGDWVAFCLDLDLKHTPGLNWSYSSIPPMLVGEVISKTSGMTIMDFAAQYLFQPLGISDYTWTITPKGRGMTAGSFYMKPRDMLKIIKLVSELGIWEDKRIVSEAWIRSSTNCSIDIEFSFLRYSRMRNAKYSSARYGLYWYREQLQYGAINTEVLFASGNGGQYMMQLKDYDALVVFTGSNYGNWRNKLPFEVLLKYLIPILESEAGR